MATPLTSIRVFVEWTDQTVFAGEDVECQITFKNIASNPPLPRTLLHPPVTNGFAPGGERQWKSASQIRNNSTFAPRPPPPSRGHRSTISLTAPVGIGRLPAGPGSWAGGHSKAPASGSTHKRSVSIISIGASESAAGDTASIGNTITGSQNIPRSHRRSASLQILPRRNGMNGPSSGKSLHSLQMSSHNLIFYQLRSARDLQHNLRLSSHRLLFPPQKDHTLSDLHDARPERRLRQIHPVLEGANLQGEVARHLSRRDSNSLRLHHP